VSLSDLKERGSASTVGEPFTGCEPERRISSIVRILRSPKAHDRDLSGFWLEFVGFHVGTIWRRDNERPRVVNNFGCTGMSGFCRVLEEKRDNVEINFPQPLVKYR
jgi:hypothetical protein